MQITIL